MKERLSATIDIKRNNATVVTVPITEACIRKFTLMEEDCIVLSFELTNAVHLAIGDYIDDEIFGRFVITKDQMPAYNTTTGGYTYSIQFDSEYMAWNNRLLMLTMKSGSSLVRKEAQWYLTANLADQAQEVLNNLTSLGITGYSVSIDQSAVKSANEVRLMSYASTHIIDAIKEMAEKWECEWWVWEKTIHFGKCEYGDEVTFELGRNVENMDIQDNRKTYADKIYIYGSQQNIPPTYRKSLVLKVTGKRTHSDGYNRIDTDKKLTADMFPISKAMNAVIYRNAFNYERTLDGVLFTSRQGEATIPVTSYYNATAEAITIESAKVTLRTDGALAMVEYTATATLCIDKAGSQFQVLSYSTVDGSARTMKDGVVSIPAITIPSTSKSAMSLQAGTNRVFIRYELKITDRNGEPMTISSMDTITCSPSTSTFLYIKRAELASEVIKVKVKGSTRYMRINVGAASRYPTPMSTNEDPDFYALTFTDANGNKIKDPVSLAVGDTITVDPSSETILVPSAYYTSEYDNPSALSRIGEARLQLPDTTTGYVILAGTEEAKAVEDVVVFDGIFPKCDLAISSITEDKKTFRQEYEGEDKTSDWQWTQYSMELTQLNGSKFPFEENFILPGNKLQIKFLSPQDVGWSTPRNGGCKLAGMTFDVAYFLDGTYTIIRNDEYGAMLPNESLCPTKGDPCVLLGWNPRAIVSLGLIAAAEARLKAKADEYKAALEEGQFTFVFNCSMMSDFMYSLSDYNRLKESGDRYVVERDSKYLIVKTGYTVYSMPVQGTRVKIVHGALSGNKSSRILGYEMKLDKPFDTPRYVVGETQAYSKLAQIEKDIKKISG